MKRFALSIFAALILTVQPAGAMSYERAMAEARFLTDKMAYELNLDDYQYQQAYDINFNYFYRLNDASDFYGSYWQARNSALEILLSTLQFRNYCRMDYFYRPVCIRRNVWTYPIYRRYPRTRFYRPAPPPPPRPRPRPGFRFEPDKRPHPTRPDIGRPAQRPQYGHQLQGRPNDRNEWDRPSGDRPHGRDKFPQRTSNRGGFHTSSHHENKRNDNDLRVQRTSDRQIPGRRGRW